MQNMDVPHTASIPEFADGKEPEALRTIGEVARALGLKQHVLRYWEEQFPMLRPLTRAGGRRYYRAGDVALLVEINRLLAHEGYTIRGARQALAERERASPADTAAEPVPDLQQVSAEPEDQIVEAVRILRRHLESVRDRLAAALAES